eukprot:Opistho-2@23347
MARRGVSPSVPSLYFITANRLVVLGEHRHACDAILAMKAGADATPARVLAGSRQLYGTRQWQEAVEVEQRRMRWIDRRASRALSAVIGERARAVIGTSSAAEMRECVEMVAKGLDGGLSLFPGDFAAVVAAVSGGIRASNAAENMASAISGIVASLVAPIDRGLVQHDAAKWIYAPLVRGCCQVGVADEGGELATVGENSDAQFGRAMAVSLAGALDSRDVRIPASVLSDVIDASIALGDLTAAVAIATVGVERHALGSVAAVGRLMQALAEHQMVSEANELVRVLSSHHKTHASLMLLRSAASDSALVQQWGSFRQRCGEDPNDAANTWTGRWPPCPALCKRSHTGMCGGVLCRAGILSRLRRGRPIPMRRAGGVRTSASGTMHYRAPQKQRTLWVCRLSSMLLCIRSGRLVMAAAMLMLTSPPMAAVHPRRK